MKAKSKVWPWVGFFARTLLGQLKEVCGLGCSKASLFVSSFYHYVCLCKRMLFVRNTHSKVLAWATGHIAGSSLQWLRTEEFFVLVLQFFCKLKLLQNKKKREREKRNGKTNGKYILKICSYINYYKFHRKTPCIFLMSWENVYTSFEPNISFHFLFLKYGDISFFLFLI